MKKHFHNFLRLMMLIGLGILIYFVGILVIDSAWDYRPENTVLKITPAAEKSLIQDRDSFSLLSWNIGYAGLGCRSDFFYDGGRMTKPSREDFDQYWKGIQGQLSVLDSIDFIMLQEVDISSARSYRTDQHAAISRILEKYTAVFVKNYDVIYVPVPLFNPLSGITSGLSSFSLYPFISAASVVFPANYSWPKKLFMPDRCFIYSEIMLPSGKKLILINTHNSAFDDGSLRNSQLNILYEYMERAYREGYYVIAGGDWNMNPEGYSNIPFISGDPAFKLSDIEGVSGPGAGWHVVYDPDYPTNRDVSALYQPGLTQTTIIDYYICSPNIHVLNTMTLYNGFSNSDHHPVYMRFGLE